MTQHNDPAYHLSKTTKIFEGPWKLIWFQECSDRIEATRLERKIKQRGMGRFLSKSPKIQIYLIVSESL